MNIFDRDVIGTYPRPDFRRENRTDLNGQWDFDFDDENRGLAERWQSGHEYSKS